MPKVSVIIPVYNTEKYLHECLDSIVNQTLEDIEIICVEDGSTDNSLSILNDYAANDTRIIVLSQENQGQSVARNAGFAIATGKYVYFMDSDDVLELDCLATCYAAAEQYQLDILYFNADVFFESDQLMRKNLNYLRYYKRNATYTGVLTGETLFEQMEKHDDYRPSPCLQFFNVEFLRKNNICFYEGIIHEDNLFSFLCIMQAHRVMHIENIFFHRRVRENSTMTKSITSNNVIGYFICYVEMNKYCKKTNKNSAIIKKYLNKIVQDAQSAYMKISKTERMEIAWPHGSMEADLFDKFIKKPYMCSVVKKYFFFIPKKTQKVMHYYRQNGLKNTIWRILQELIKYFPEKKDINVDAIPEYKADVSKYAISVIIPMYNAEKYIEQTIQSVLQQDLEDIEVICVDDGSTDSTYSIVSHIAKKYNNIKVFKQPNCRAGIARNRGILEAQGEYLLFLDADDFLQENMLKELFNKAKHTDSDIVIFEADKYDEASNVYANMPWMLNRNYISKLTVFNLYDIPDKIMNITAPGPCNKIFKREFILNNNITFAHLRNSEDVPFTCLALCLAEKITCHYKTILHIRRGHDTNLEATKDQDTLEFYEAFLILKAKLIQHGLYDKVKQSFANRALESCVYQLESLKTEDGKNEVRDILALEGFKKLDILGNNDKYFYNKNDFDKVKELLLKSENSGYIPDRYKISVIVPVYNVEPYLPQCLDSILNQSLKEFELICVDDGSTDNSLNILNEYAAKDNRVKVLQQKNRYAGVARNEGIKIAQGECLLFLDSDDFFEDTLLEKLYRKYQETLSDVVVCAIDLYDNSTATYKDAPWTLYNNILPDKDTFSRNDIPDDILLFVTGSPWNKLVRRSFILDNQLYFQNTRRTNDLYFVFATLAKAERISVVNEKLVHYRVGMKNNLQANNNLNPFDHLAALYKLKYELINAGIYDQVERSYINLALNNSMYTLYSMKNDKQAFNKVVYRANVFDLKEMQIKNKSKEYFKNEHHFKQYNDIFLKNN